MQNQRNTRGNVILYRSYWDCAAHVWRNEGVLGFYQGIGVQAMVIFIPFKLIHR